MRYILQTTFEGRPYEVEVDPTARRQPLNRYVSVYRLKKDGSRGLHLSSYHAAAWAILKQIEDSVPVLADEECPL